MHVEGVDVPQQCNTAPSGQQAPQTSVPAVSLSSGQMAVGAGLVKNQSRQTFTHFSVFKFILFFFPEDFPQGHGKPLPISSPKSPPTFGFSLHSVYTVGAAILNSFLAGTALGGLLRGLPA